jgi:hypothetical protein
MMAIEDKKHKLNKLKEEHCALDEEIARLTMSPLYDQLAVQRLKKRKLKLKDEINKLKTKLIPDIIA